MERTLKEEGINNYDQIKISVRGKGGARTILKPQEKITGTKKNPEIKVASWNVRGKWWVKRQKAYSLMKEEDLDILCL